MAGFESQKAEKLTVEEVARIQLDGEFLREFEDFYGFLKEEKIRLAWKSINGFKATYKGKGIAAITFSEKNYIGINVATADVAWNYGYGFDEYLERQSDEIKDLFMEQISNKCVHCRPTCGCSSVSGRTVIVSGERYENVCMNAPNYKFFASGNSMQSVTMCTPRAVYPPEEVRYVPLETVKNLILARKTYVERSL